MKIRKLYWITALSTFIYFESCSPQSPSDQMMDLLVQYVEVLKTTHIYTQRDVDVLNKKIEVLNVKKENIKKTEMQMMKEMSQKEIEEYSLKMMEKMERSGIMEISEQESNRIKKEAEKAGLEINLF